MHRGGVRSPTLPLLLMGRSLVSLRLRAGDFVEVRSAAEILATLDGSAALDGLPFMPEMLAYCGRRFRVDKRADKTCDTIHYEGSRRMRDTVHLEGMRCDGSAHGGCQALCPMYWKEAWLKRVDERASQTDDDAGAGGVESVAGAGVQMLTEATRREPDHETGEVRYRCQATDLLLASEPMRWWDFRQYVRDVWSGNVVVWDVVRVASFYLFRRLIHARWFRGYGVAMKAYNRFQARRGGRPYPVTHGSLKKTPRATLDLVPGELVRIKSQDEILRTVDRRGRNRGLSFDPEMTRYCGSTHRVLSRVERIIEEKSGRMVTMSNDCIVLEGAVCRAECSHRRLLCPRALYPFWREIWLERVEEAGTAQATSARAERATAGARQPGGPEGSAGVDAVERATAIPAPSR
jgi:hypothetical protein